MKSLQDKGMEPQSQQGESVLPSSISSEETVALGPSINRFNALLTMSDEEET